MLFFFQKRKKQKEIQKLALESSEKIMQRIEQIPHTKENLPALIELVGLATLLGGAQSKERIDELLSRKLRNQIF